MLRRLFPFLASALSGAKAVTFLLRDDFTTDEPAPIASPRTAEPGPGVLTLTDTGSIFSVSSGELSPGGGVATGTDDPRGVSQALTRETGLCVYHRAKRPGGDGGPEFGFVTNSITVNNNVVAHYLGSSSTVLARIGGTVSVGSIGVYAVDTYYDFFVIARSQGYFFIQDDDLLWVSNSGSDATLHAIYTVLTSGRPLATYETIRATVLPVPFDDDYGIATERHAGSVSQGQEFTHEADCFIEFEIATLPSNNAKVNFRMQDATNTWQLKLTSVGNCELREIVGGSSVLRGSASGVLSGGDRVVIICDDETITVYSSSTQALSYSSAANFKTETAGELDSLGTGGAVSDLITWPRTLSGAAKAALDAVADA